MTSAGEAGRGGSPGADEKTNEEYFASYEDVEIHRLMVSDAPRTQAYASAIRKNKHLFEGKVAMDVGAGTGILSLFMAAAGARRVHAVEASGMAAIIDKVAEDNGFRDVIQVHHARVEDVTLPDDEKVDVIVSEWMGFYRNKLRVAVAVSLDMAEFLPQVESYKGTVKEMAEELVKKKFPERIIHFNKLLEESPFLCENLETVHSDLKIPVPEPIVVNNHDGDPPGKKRKMPDGAEDAVTGAKVFVLPSGSVPINSHITQMVDTIKPLICQLVEEANLLKMWISFLIPKIEDGNNFGVSIQEETLGEIRTVESEAASFFDQISRYYMTRAKLVSKVAKYPHIDDYRRTVVELDEKEYLSLRITLSEIRNHYATLHDMITKNMEKIKKPRSTNSIEAMY